MPYLCQARRPNLYLTQPYLKNRAWENNLMDLQFEIGDPQRPRGHALLYFRVETEPDQVYGTYIVTLPITADLTKYVPPFLASHLGTGAAGPLANFSSFAMPPMGELVQGGYDQLVRLANLRQDDLVFGGSMFSYDLARMMESVSEAVQAYSSAWAQVSPGAADAVPGGASIPLGASQSEVAPVVGDDAAESDGMGVNEVLWSFMSEGDRLAELSRLLGRLRFAQEGNDTATIADVTAEMAALGRLLPREFYIDALVSAAFDTSAEGARLAQLYLERCYSLSSGNAEQTRRIDEQIGGFQSGS